MVAPWHQLLRMRLFAFGTSLALLKRRSLHPRLPTLGCSTASTIFDKLNNENNLLNWIWSNGKLCCVHKIELNTWMDILLMYYCLTVDKQIYGWSRRQFGSRGRRHIAEPRYQMPCVFVVCDCFYFVRIYFLLGSILDFVLVTC
jgi:hypothetical protein